MGLKSLVTKVADILFGDPPPTYPVARAAPPAVHTQPLLPNPESRALLALVPVKDMQPLEYKEFCTLPVQYKVEVAQSYAKDTGRCMFCNRHLMDSRSRRVGYGKTCAARFNLPWG